MRRQLHAYHCTEEWRYVKQSMTDGVIYARKKAAAAATPAKPREPDRAPAPLKTGVEVGTAVAELLRCC